jgi:hypothetical protein
MAAPREPLTVTMPLEQFAQAFDALFHTRNDGRTGGCARVSRLRFREPELCWPRPSRTSVG